MKTRVLCWSLGSIRRSLFSQSGQWEELTVNVKRRIEAAWGPQVKQAVERRSQAQAVTSHEKLKILSDGLLKEPARILAISDVVGHFHQMNRKNEFYSVYMEAFLSSPEKSRNLKIMHQLEKLGLCSSKTGMFFTSQPELFNTNSQYTAKDELVGERQRDNLLEEYGCDTTRLILIANSSPSVARNFSKEGLVKWQHRIWENVQQFVEQRSGLKEPSGLKEQMQKEEKRLWEARNFFLSATTFNYNSLQLSTAVSLMQGLTNSLRRTPPELIGTLVQFERSLALQLLMLAPMAPHFASELWAAFVSSTPKSTDFQWNKPLLEQQWPKLDLDYKLDFNIKLNEKDVATVKLSQEEFRKMKPDEALKKAQQLDRFRNLLGTWIITGIELERKEDYQLIFYVTSERQNVQDPDFVHDPNSKAQIDYAS